MTIPPREHSSANAAVDSGSDASARVGRAAEEFRAAFGGPAQWVAVAPGRVNLIGEHIDYLGGTVLPIAINRATEAAIASNNVGAWRIRAAAFPSDARVVVPVSAEPERQPLGWVNYPLGVLAEIQKLIALGNEIGVAAARAVASSARAQGFDVWIRGDVPLGAGLSSSASVEVAVAAAMNAAFKLGLSPAEIALLCVRAERGFVGVPCGAMDQAASALGRAGCAVALDCGEAKLAPEYARIPHGAAFLVMHSGVSRGLGASEYELRQKQCARALVLIARAADMAGRDGCNSSTALANVDPDLALALAGGENFAAPGLSADDAVALRRALHASRENRRVGLFRVALASGDLPAAGRLMNESHASLRDLYEVSTPELDDLTSLARAIPGVHGARLTGAGFGGCALALVDAAAGDAALAAIRAAYYHPRGIDAPVFLTPASGGAAAFRVN